MTPFAYERAASAGAAIGAAEAGSAYLAGGTCLLDLMKQGVERPGKIIDLGQVKELTEVRVTERGTLRLGAMAIMSHVARDPVVTKGWPLLALTIGAGLTPQLRNAATIGGNVMQRPRCIYFRDPGYDCNKKVPGSGCAAKVGVHLGHALFGGEAADACIAVHPSDLCVALTTLDAQVHYRVAGAPVERRVALEDFLRLPDEDPTREAELPRGGLIVAIELPPQDGRGGAYAKSPEGGFAMASVAALIAIHRGRITQASLILGGVAHKPWRASVAEAALMNGIPGPELFAGAAERAVERAQTDDQTAFRVALLQALVMQALTEASEQARGRS